MKFGSKVIFCAAMAMMPLFPSAYAATLTFEDLNPSPASFDVLSGTYSGFSFSGWLYGVDTLYKPASGVIDLFTDYADPADPTAYVITNNNSITGASSFYFDGASFSGYSGVTFELYADGSLVHTSSSLDDAVGPDAYLPTFLQSGYAGIVDTVKVRGVQGYFAMDDFVYRPAGVITAVPEPETFVLVFVGLLAVGAASRRKRG